MKNKLLLFFLFFSIITSLKAENLNIESKIISIDKNSSKSIFENDVLIKTENGYEIKSNYAEYDKKKKYIILKKNVIAKDNKNNLIQTEFAEYDENKKILKSKGFTKIITSEKYIIESEDIIFDNSKNFIQSEKKTKIFDQDNNIIFLDNFKYQIETDIFKSIGFIEIEDKMKNSYKFSQIYIDTKNKEILGTDIKAFINQNDFKINDRNKPRVFSNSIKIDNDNNTFNKSIFTLCDYRKNDKCPPWSIQAKRMLHNKKKKTIYYDNAVVKIYDVPIFYFPKLSHPDPSVKRRSGFLIPSFFDSKNLGTGVSIPYFWAINKDKNFTLTNKFYGSENPLFSGEYHQAFRNSNFLADFGYTDGYKKNTAKKQAGKKTHFFSKFTKNFDGEKNNSSNLTITTQKVSNDKYLKLYKIKSTLVDFNQDTLENSINFTKENDDLYFNFNASVYETLKENYEDKYEYIFPDILFDKNLFSNNNLGNLDLQTNLKVNSYDTNKFSNFLINDFVWNYKDIKHKSGFMSKFLGNFKNINYETKNIDIYKEDPTSEFFGALGYLAKINLQKTTSFSEHFLKPKLLLRYAPGSMRLEKSGLRLDPVNAFSLDRLNSVNNFETGLSTSIGLDYNIKRNKSNFDFSIAQIINAEENDKMPDNSSLNEKLSDLVGSTKLELNENIDLKYNFSLDQNYKNFNYNEIGATINYENFKFNFDYILEEKHIGDQEYFKTKIDLVNKNNNLLSFETKRNLVTNSSEFYNLSYEYMNDCLRAGLVYRREFYTDSEIESENSLMFKITLVPFGSINGPSFN